VSRIETTIVIDRPIEDVWAFLTDPHNLASWIPEADQVTPLSDGPFGKGAMLRVSGRVGPLRVSTTQQVTDFESQRVIELRSVGGSLWGSVLTRVDLQRADVGTRVTGTSEAHGLPGMLAALDPGRGRDREEFFASLKRSLEADIAHPPVAESSTAATDSTDAAGSGDPDAAAIVADSTVASSSAVLAPSEDGTAEIPALAAERTMTPPPTPEVEAAVEVPRAPSADEDRLVLRLETEGGPAPTYEVTRSGATLGRAPENTIRLDDLSVSRRHARITYRQHGYWLSDLRSTSGTWVDGTKLNAPRRIAAGQMIGIGILRLSARFAAAGDEPPPQGAATPPPEMARQRRRRR